MTTRSSLITSCLNKATGLDQSMETSKGPHLSQNSIKLSSSVSSLDMQLLLGGPSQSGKTSIAMDFACSIASSSCSGITCHSCGLRHYPININAAQYENESGDGEADESDKYCTCCAVAYLMPESKREDLLFPLRCSNFEESEIYDESALNGIYKEESHFVKEEKRFKEQMRLLELDGLNKFQPETDGSSATASSSRTTKQKRHYWEEDFCTLQKIKVKYVKSISDLLHFLGSMHSFLPKMKPWGGIIIDDLDYFIQADYDSTDLKTEVNSFISPSRSDLNKVTGQQKKHPSTSAYMKLIQLCK